MRWRAGGWRTSVCFTAASATTANDTSAASARARAFRFIPEDTIAISWRSVSTVLIYEIRNCSLQCALELQKFVGPSTKLMRIRKAAGVP